MPFLAVAAKDLRDILRERSIVAALLVQFFIAAFSAFLTVGLLGIYDPDSAPAASGLRVAYVGPGGFDRHLASSPGLGWEPMAIEDALDAFGRGEVDAVIEESYGDAAGERTVTALLAEGEIPSTLLTTRLKGLLEDYERELREEWAGRLEAPVLSVEGPTGRAPLPYGFLYGTLLPLLVLTPVFLAGATAGDGFAQEVQQKTLLLLRSAPLGVPALLAGKLLVPLGLVPVQVVLWVGLLGLNGIEVLQLPLLLAWSLLLAMVLCGTALLGAAAAPRQGQAQAVYALAALLLAVSSLALPRDLFNTTALIATDAMDGAAWATLGWVLAAGVAALALGLTFAARQVRNDRL